MAVAIAIQLGALSIGQPGDTLTTVLLVDLDAAIGVGGAHRATPDAIPTQTEAGGGAIGIVAIATGLIGIPPDFPRNTGEDIGHRANPLIAHLLAHPELLGEVEHQSILDHVPQEKLGPALGKGISQIQIRSNAATAAARL